MRGDGGVAGEGRVVGVPKFHSWAKCTMTLTNINSDWMSNASSGLRIILCYIILGECSALWGEREGVVWYISVPLPKGSAMESIALPFPTSHITIVSFPGLPHLQL